MSTQHRLADDRMYLTEAGLETELVFFDGLELPEFASFPLLDAQRGRERIRDYYSSFVELAGRSGHGIVIETPTWRANADRGVKLGYSAPDLDRINRDAVTLLREIAEQRADVDVVVSGNLGPRGDGYVVGDLMTPNEAAAYHLPQVRSLAAAGADRISAFTLTYVAEAIGIVMAAVEVDMPVVISFTVETDGRLPSGDSLGDAIEQVDAATDGAAASFMVNCAHPTHFLSVFEQAGPWHRISGVRANASTLSHAELDEATELDRGDIDRFADGFRSLRSVLPNLRVVGGCCGTDREHLEAISRALEPATA